MGKIRAVPLLLLALGAGACGDPSRTAERAESTCAPRGITAPPYREGACLQDGRRYVVASGRSAVRLRTLAARLRYVTVDEEVGGATPRHGFFLRIRLAVRNTTAAPRRFRPGQTSLRFDGRWLEEQVGVQRRDDDALAAGRTIPPGEAIEGVVVYDVAPRAMDAIMRGAALYVAGFEPQTARSEVGLFRFGDVSRRAPLAPPPAPRAGA